MGSVLLCVTEAALSGYRAVTPRHGIFVMVLSSMMVLS